MKRITCVCGKVVEGKDDDQLWEEAQAHLAADHGIAPSPAVQGVYRRLLGEASATTV
jgi:hypothetical protein